MPLFTFPKTFGLAELKNGYFLHLFNTPCNQSYIRRIPNTSYFMPDVMSVSARRDFEAWHTRQRVANVIYNFQKEWLNNASLTSNSSSRGVSPSSLYLNLWLASIPFPTLPSPLLATGISVRTTWRLTRLPTNCFTGGAWTPTTLALPWNGSTGNSTSYWMKTIPSDMPAILTSAGFPIPGTL